MRVSTFTRYVLASWGLIVLCGGCQQFNLRSQSPEEMEETSDDEFTTTVKTPLIGEYVTVHGLNLITLEGVGLVTGLDGTGGDPPPSRYRTALVDDMRKRGMREPNQMLRSPDTALVVVRASLPPLVQKGDQFDLNVRLIEGSEATSLNGGWLMETYLSEQAIVPGRGVLAGHIFAKGKGPILISTGEGNDPEGLVGVRKRGRVLGGGSYIWKEDRHLTLALRNDFRSVRNSKRIASRIGTRFSAYDRYGIKEPLAEAKTDQSLVLKIHPRYKNNFPRYLQVARNIAFRETPVAQRVRMQKLEKLLNEPETAELSAVKLEAIGTNAIPILKRALTNSSLEVRLHAAMALAYLEVPDGLNDLAEAARTEPAFRVFALAAMAAIDDAEAHLLLRDLMNEQSAETRYGAFRALWTLDRNDSFIRPQEEYDEFALHVLPTESDPMIHITHRRRAEIVLFGADQQFHTPMAVRAGNRILVTSQPGSDSVTISRYEAGKPDRREVVSSRVSDVIHAAAELGASYPDIAQMLVQATKQHNVPGRVEIDALPQAGRIYYRPSNADGDSTQRTARVGAANSNLIPNMFPATSSRDDSEDLGESKGPRGSDQRVEVKKSPEIDANPPADGLSKGTNQDQLDDPFSREDGTSGGTASLADVGGTAQSEPDGRWRGFGLFRARR